MAYQVLARKWRPQDFSSIVGQQPVVTALRNAVAEDRIAQAYLFAGIRGVGKTTAARVFAKALNCETRSAALERGEGSDFTDPCNECGSCTEIATGSSLDVIEIDAATYSKVEQVRELTESLQYGPARAPYKVVVLDEIHRLSRQAFDALLKIVEEPPPHLVFVFATTEVETVPATILSRCQEFHFRRVQAAELTPLLRSICEAEEIEANDRSLRFIARAGEGSVRDSVALLDQLATYGSGTVSEEDAVRLLGGLDFAFFHSLLSAILGGDSAKVSGSLLEIEQQGWDPRRVHTQFLGYCRDGLHAAVGASIDQIDLPEDDAKHLSETARGEGYENLLRLLQQLLTSEELVRRSETPALAVEIAWLKAAELPKLIAIEEVLAGSSGLGVRTDPAPPPTTAAPVAENAVVDEPTTPPEGPAVSTDPLEAFLQRVSQRKQPLAARLREAPKLDFSDGQLTISVPRGDPWIAEALQRTNNRELIEVAVKDSWGPGATWQTVEIEVASQDVDVDEGDADPRTASERASVAEHPIVQSALDLFSGTIESVQPLSAKSEGDE
jgi:DNA polymerase-3 subunit gamma/tau